MCYILFIHAVEKPFLSLNLGFTNIKELQVTKRIVTYVGIVLMQIIFHRILEQHYPYPATEADYMRSLVNATEVNDCDYTHLFVLHQFMLESKKLQVGGALLPELLEFYKWIHTHLSHLVTYEKAQKITIGNVIDLTAKRYSQKLHDHLANLFKDVTSKNKLFYVAHISSSNVATCVLHVVMSCNSMSTSHSLTCLSNQNSTPSMEFS